MKMLQGTTDLYFPVASPMLSESGLILSGYCHSETGLVHESSFDKAVFSSFAALCPLRPAGLINIKMITADTNLPDRAPILIFVLLKVRNIHQN